MKRARHAIEARTHGFVGGATMLKVLGATIALVAGLSVPIDDRPALAWILDWGRGRSSAEEFRFGGSVPTRR